MSFLPGFFLGQGEKYTRKKLVETQSMKTQVKSGEIPVHKNFGKIMQNVDSRRLTPKSAKLTCYPILKFSHGKILEQIWQCQKQIWQTGGFSYKEKKYIDGLECGTIWYRTARMWDFTRPTFRIFEIFERVRCRTCDMGPYKWLYRRL